MMMAPAVTAAVTSTGYADTFDGTIVPLNLGPPAAPPPPAILTKRTAICTQITSPPATWKIAAASSWSDWASKVGNTLGASSYTA